MELFFKECKKVLFSLTFLIFAIAMVVFFKSQFLHGDMEENSITKPLPNQESYGTVEKEVPELLMPAATKSLINEFQMNNYTAYPIGFYKNVKLNSKKQAKIAEILSELTGTSAEEILASETDDTSEQQINVGNGDTLQKNENGDFQIIVPDINENASTLSLTVRDDISYEKFRELMEQADDIIGGGSQYDDTYILQFSQVPITYEEALADYTAVIEKDKITGAYARLFCDYLGIMAGLLPVFIAVTVCTKDKRSGMNSLVYTRQVSSFKLIAIRYLAMLSVIMALILVLAGISAVKVAGLYPNEALDSFAFFNYTLGWIMPTVMVSLAVGVFLTELTGTPIAIAVQGLWWFLDMFAGMRQMKGGYGGLVLSPRHNSKGNTQIFLDNFNTLLFNRLFYIVISIVLIALTVVVYELKRRGKIGDFHLLQRNHKVKSEA